MSERAPSEDERWRLSVVEGRREQVEAFTWSIPGLAIAGQAFLLSIVLGDVTPKARLVAALAGLIAALASTQLYAKQVYLFDLYEGFLERERLRLGLPGTQTDELKAGGFPSNTMFAKRDWDSTWWRRAFTDRKAANVWFGALLGFSAIDAFLFVYSGYSLIFGDPRWF